MKLDVSKQNAIKDALGQKAASYVQNGMIIGLGTGTTASYFIKHLSKKCRQESLKIQAMCSSVRSAEQAILEGIPVAEADSITRIDLTIDGADEVDPENRMVKGGGGALLREKIVASSSDQIIIMVDESKLVAELGAFGVPIEILPFGSHTTIAKLKKLGYAGALRKKNEKEPYLTDNGNYIFDIKIPDRFPEPEEDHRRIIDIPGVLGTGFFFNLATQVLVGYFDGQIKLRE